MFDVLEILIPSGLCKDERYAVTMETPEIRLLAYLSSIICNFRPAMTLEIYSNVFLIRYFVTEKFAPLTY